MWTLLLLPALAAAYDDELLLLQHRLNAQAAREALMSNAHAAGCRSLHVEVTEKAHELRNIRWLHFPKAGTSFISTIWNYACARKAPLDLAIGKTHVYDFALMSRYPSVQYCEPGVLSDRFITQHQAVTLHEVKQRGWNVIGMFRKPSQRLISAFHNSMHTSWLCEEDRHELVETCAQQNHTPACYARFPGIAGCTARMLTGGRCAEGRMEREEGEVFDAGASSLSQALQMLEKMAFVGMTEQWDLSICLFHRMFGGNVSASQLVDIHTFRGDHEGYDESVLEGFVDHVDEQIYEAASRRFNQLLQEHVGSDLSVCGGIMKRSEEEEKADTCSCESQGMECGRAPSGLECGTCPTIRIKEMHNMSDADVQCDAGKCFVNSQHRPDIFAWSV